MVKGLALMKQLNQLKQLINYLDTGIKFFTVLTAVLKKIETINKEIMSNLMNFNNV